MNEPDPQGHRPTSVARGETKKGAAWILVTASDLHVIRAIEHAISAVGDPAPVVKNDPGISAAVDRPAPDAVEVGPHDSRGESGGVDRRDPSPLTSIEILARTRADLAELQRRGVLRGGNAPAGDYAEWLVRRSTSDALGPHAQRSWNVLTPEGERHQVKARIVTDHRAAGQRQLSVIRSWDFDAVIAVLFDDAFGVWKAVKLPVDLCRAAAYFIERVNGYRIMATDALLATGENWTEQLRRHSNAD